MIEHVEIEYESSLELDRMIREQGWTDGLPINLPTPERVGEFLEASGLDPDEVVGTVAPMGGRATIGVIAVNAVMAGCAPEHMPVVVAAVRALIDEPFNLYMVQVTTNPVAPLAVVNGPVRRSAGIRCGRDALGPGPGGNGPIGRAVRFVIRNVGGIGGNDMATHGSPAKYTLCIGEDEESSPWEPLHVWQGYAADQSVVTMLGIESIIDVVPQSGTTNAENLIAHLAHSLRTVGTNVFFTKGNPVLVLTGAHAHVLHEAGYDRGALQQRLFEDGAIDERSLPFPNIDAGMWTVVDGRIVIAERPEDIYIIVGGGWEGHHSLHMIGWCLGRPSHARVVRASRP